MKIRLKLIALIAGIFLILGAVQILIEKRIVMPSFAELERTGAHTAMRRIDSALTQIVDRVAISATEWGNWDETYRYVVAHDPQFITSNVTDIGLRQLDINVLLLVTTEGHIIIARDLDLTADRPLRLDLTARKALPEDFPWRKNLREGRTVQGLLQTNRGILMLAGAPVLDGYGHGPSRGMLFMGRLLTNAVVADIGAQAQSQLIMLPPAVGAPREVLEESEGLTRVYRSYADIYGRPVMRLRLDVPREITMRGRAAVSYASACLIAAAVIVVLLLVVVLNRMILRPLALVTRHAVALGEDRDLTTRLDLERGDEIGVLAREFDRMVGRVAESRTQLVDQSYQAGFAELAKGVLHNLGNAMTPIGVRLATLAERLRVTPAADAAQAAAELQQGCDDGERSRDLREFLRLACKELATTIHNAQEDVALVTRQTSVIQGALAEQMRAARNEHVIEPVRLTELVAQSLEIVPDACRARLRIDTDETVRRLGVVRVARTMLRLVLQNLIINAADAVRDAGKERGVLRVSAEIVRDAERSQLHLQCQDDGVGIAPQNLERVFEKGFSTKSPETNHGIGLHWCANVIGALGGRIWAASDGPGCGASLHVLVPLASHEPASLAGAA
ncbi:MAG TPA: CHASE4 domain-containing protein [Steroidobacteraceae bacterium]|nr:CHASE4 domain-containing protein [Steroidobacteraceae bacterium]